MAKYRVLVPGWLDRGDHIPPGEFVDDYRLPDIPNLDALCKEGVLELVDDEPVAEPKAAARVKSDG